MSRRGELEIDSHGGIGGKGEQGRVAAVGEVEVTAAGVRAGEERLTLRARFENEPAGVGPEPCPEYAPQPPFSSGEPETAAKPLVDAVLAARQPLIAAARAAAERAKIGR